MGELKRNNDDYLIWPAPLELETEPYIIPIWMHDHRHEYKYISGPKDLHMYWQCTTCNHVCRRTRPDFWQTWQVLIDGEWVNTWDPRFEIFDIYKQTGTLNPGTHPITITKKKSPLVGALPWAGFFQRRCAAVLEPRGLDFYGRCELKRNHPLYMDHALERGFMTPRWSTQSTG